MNDDTTKPTEPTEPTAEAAAPKPETPKPYVDPSIAAEGEDDRLAAEVADLKDKLLRTLAEMENLRRRTEREVKDAGTYAVTRFAREMLAVGDNLRRALETAPEEARAEGSVFKGVLEGVELTEKTLLQALGRFGVKAIEAEGQKFDPNLHQAMYEVPNPELPNGTVVQVVQQGFVIADRVLRPALVAVSKGGPKPAAEAHMPTNIVT
jgi:molecular chaperone GrpE